MIVLISSLETFVGKMIPNKEENEMGNEGDVNVTVQEDVVLGEM